MTTRPKKLLDSLVKTFKGSRNKEGKEEEDLEKIAASEQKVFRYEKLAAATHNFSPKQKLGEGGFGPVFKGRLEDGREVAVKQLGRGSRQGAKEFQNEAMLLSRVQHKNVVNLYGYSAHGDDKLLVYEYVSNESLDKLLFSSADNGRRRAELDWARRYQVMVGVARGLLYLHEDAHIPIVHRDIKASNILLDDRWVPKIADFGMARLFPEDRTFVNTRVAGTNGYMPPEYVMHGNLSTKCDVFSFGVVVLELVSGRRNSAHHPLPDPDATTLVEWAWKLYKKGQALEFMDPTMASTADPEQVAMCVQLGLLCTQSDPKLRPDMKRVVIILSKKPAALEEPTRPGIPGARYQWRSYGTGGSRSTLGESSSSSASASAPHSASTAALTATTSATLTSTHPASSHGNRSASASSHGNRSASVSSSASSHGNRSASASSHGKRSARR